MDKIEEIKEIVENKELSIIAKKHLIKGILAKMQIKTYEKLERMIEDGDKDFTNKMYDILNDKEIINDIE